MQAFGDSFDSYAAPNDALLGYWDGGSTSFWLLTTGRFTGSQAVTNQATNAVQPLAYKNSGANDAVHHIVCSYIQTVGLSGTALGMAVQLLDGTTAQCSIVFRSDGAILLQSGAPGGATLATYTGAFPSGAWTAFEFEVVIHPTAGSFTVRKNGNTSNDFSAISLNTRPGANSYANRLQLGWTPGLTAPINSGGAFKLDDVFWRSDASSVPWVGDIRAYQLMPASNVNVQFSVSPSNGVIPVGTGAIGGNISANQGVANLFTAPLSGVCTGGSFMMNANGTGNIKWALYDASFNLIATSNQVTNPVLGSNNFTWVANPTLVRGNTYYLAFDADTAFTVVGLNVSGLRNALAYAGFPPSSISSWTSGSRVEFQSSLTIASVPNFGAVNDITQDGAASYVYDSVVGHNDLYAIAGLPVTPPVIAAVTTRGFMAKSDAGTRFGQLQLKSGAVTVQSAALALSTNFLWNYRTDLNDPATAAPWTVAGVNNLQIGPVVQA